jgi:hypothetical protein
MPDVFLRWDVEDFLTPAADYALDAILEIMDKYRVRANFAVVGLRARSLRERGRGSWIRRMARLGTVGSHSWSHSVHPTLAEASARADRAEAEARLRNQEERTRAVLADLGAPPRFFTQPGGNWVPEALTVGPRLGWRAVVSEAWNAYWVPTAAPVAVGDLWYWTLPVDIPKGFLFRLPDGVEAAWAGVEAAWRAGRPAGLVSHPTELVTTAFWDAANFGGGQNRRPWVPAPTRPAAEWASAVRALDRFFARLAEADPRWITVDEWPHPVPRPAAVPPDALREGLAREGFGPVADLSAAQVLYLLAVWAVEGRRAPAAPPDVGAPLGTAHGRDPVLAVREYAETFGYLPARVNDEDIETLARRLAEQEVPGLAWTLDRWLRPVSALHWDWPIFPPGFAAPRLYDEARRLCWLIRRASADGAGGGEGR